MKNVKEFNKKIKKLRSTEKGNAAFKLGVECLFIVFVLFIIVTGNNKSQNNVKDLIDSGESKMESKTEYTYLDKENKLKSGTYSYTFDITGSLKVKYSGKYTNGNAEGYREDSSNIIKYSIENNTVYKVDMDNKTPYTDLYVGLDANLFDYNYLFDTLNSKSAIIDNKDNDITYTYENINGYNIVVKMDNENINEIVIKSDALTYDFKYTY